ncbi:hypothetical protein SNEBB_005423 [Seison nebaliae]|nr:hypothetical protein SNEBB_005423 [Seison nebaliae]
MDLDLDNANFANEQLIFSDLSQPVPPPTNFATGGTYIILVVFGLLLLLLGMYAIWLYDNMKCIPRGLVPLTPRFVGAEKKKLTAQDRYVEDENVIRAEVTVNDMKYEREPERTNFDYKTTTLPVSTMGRIWFALECVNFIRLRVTVIKAANLAGATPLSPETFVRVQLLPDKDYKQTNVVKGRNPNYHESLNFEVPESNITERYLKLTIFDTNTNEDDPVCIGSTIYALSDTGALQSLAYGKIVWRDLIPEQNDAVYMLEMQVCISDDERLLKISIRHFQRVLASRVTYNFYIRAILIWKGEPLVLKRGRAATLHSSIPVRYFTNFNFDLFEKMKEYMVLIEVIAFSKTSLEQSLGHIFIGSEDAPISQFVENGMNWYQLELKMPDEKDESE